MYLVLEKFQSYPRVIYTTVDWIIRRKGGSGKWTERSTKLDRHKIYRKFKI